jgi:hypothetical protein
MPSPVQESLIALAQSITAAISQSGPGLYRISLNAINPLRVPDATPVRSVTSGAVDLSLVMKNVRFTNANLTDITTVGGMPIQEFALQLLESSVAGAPGVPGLLGSLKGTVPVVVDSVNSLLAVQIQVRVSVRDDNNQLDPYLSWSFSNGATGVGGQGTSAPDTEPPTATLQWLPGSPVGFGEPKFVGAFVELNSPLPDNPSLPLSAQPANRTVTVEVNLGAAGVSTGWIALPPLPVTIPAIPIPTLVAFFDDIFFNALGHLAGEAGTLILLPDDSPLTPPAPGDDSLRVALSAALGTISELVKNLVATGTGTNGFNPFNPLAPLASIIDDLVNDLDGTDSAPEIHFAKASTVPGLGDNKFLIHGNDTAQDRISAMLVLGPAGLTVRSYNDANFDSRRGEFDVRLGVEMGVAVPTLDATSPPSIPDGKLTVVTMSADQSHSNTSNSFNDCLSSVQIVKP